MKATVQLQETVTHNEGSTHWKVDIKTEDAMVPQPIRIQSGSMSRADGVNVPLEMLPKLAEALQRFYEEMKYHTKT